MNIFKPSKSKLTNNKSGQSLISLILIMTIIIGLVVCGIVLMNNPKFIFQKEIDKIFNTANSKDFKTVKA